MPLVFIWEVDLSAFCLLRMDCDAADEVPVTVSGMWYVLPLWVKMAHFALSAQKIMGS